MSRWRGLTFVLGAYSAFRVVDLGLFAAVAARDELSLRSVLMSWDGGWYRRAATEGWPADVARTTTGVLEQSAWAWPPLYPALGRFVSGALGAPVEAALVGINVVTGALAAIILFLSLRAPLGDRASVVVAVVWAGMPAAPVFWMAYAEGLFVLLAFAAMWAAMRDRLLLAGLLLIGAGITKSSVLPFALALAIVAIGGLRARSWQPQRIAGAVGVVVLSAVAVLAWPVVVAIALGSADAYGQVQAAWGRSTVPGYDTWKAALGFVWTPTLETAVGVLIAVIAVIAGVLVWRDSRVPAYLRLVGVISPAFLLATGAALSSARLLLPDPAVPTAIRRMMTGWVSATLVLVTLTAARAAWIATFVSGSPGEPPP